MTIPAASAHQSRWATPLVASILMLAGTAAYWNTLDAPFVLDDLTSITTNSTIRQLWPLDQVLATPRGTGTTVDGRPVLNLSFALNHALGGLNPRGYHVVNLLIHVINGCLLYGIVRRTLSRAGLRPALQQGRSETRPTSEVSLLLSAVAALLWTLHPLATAAVTYTAQRAESLMACWFLLTLYAFVRSVDASRPSRWRSLAIVACFAGTATKEVMVVAPLVVLLYDRTFVAGSFASALRQRGPMHGFLAASWLLAAWLIFGGESRAGTAGFATGISSWHYAVTQCDAVLHYLQLSVWPAPLVFDYGTNVVLRLTDVWFQAATLLVLLGAVLFALRRNSAVGFIGAVFFLVLAPSSSVLPVATQTMAEHRMYLPLAACIALLVAVGARWLGWRTTVVTALGLAPVLGLATHHRNADYQSEVALWRDTVGKHPNNARAFGHLGAALVRAGDDAGAVEAFTTSLRLGPDASETHTNLGNLYFAAGRIDDAIQSHREAVRLRPDSAPTQASLGVALLASRRPTEALPSLEEARRLDPTLPGLESQLGIALLQLDRPDDAVPHLERATRSNPNDIDSHYHLGSALIALRRLPEAMHALETTLRLDPDHIPAHNNLGNLLLLARRAPEAVPHFEAVVRRHADSAAAHTNLALALILARDVERARIELRTALQLDPTYEPARTNLERLEATP